MYQNRLREMYRKVIINDLKSKKEISILNNYEEITETCIHYNKYVR